jgi:hypothetical protein
MWGGQLKCPNQEEEEEKALNGSGQNGRKKWAGMVLKLTVFINPIGKIIQKNIVKEEKIIILCPKNKIK